MDRIVRLVCETVDGGGRRTRLALIAELTGRHSNVVLIEEATGRILDALHRTPPQDGARRVLMPGETYGPPPVPPKRDPRAATREEALRLLALEPAPVPVARSIAALYDGFGPFAAREVLVRGARPRYPPRGSHGRGQGADRRRLPHAGGRGRGGALCAGGGAGRRGPAPGLLGLSPAQAPGPLSPCPSPSQAAAAYFNHRLATLGVQRQRQRLERLVAAARARLGRKVENLRQDLAGAAVAEEYRLYGELLTAHLHRIPRGETVTLPNYHAGDAPVTIPWTRP